MRALHWYLALCVLVGEAPTVAFGRTTCGAPEISSAREVNRFWSLQAIAVVERARQANSEHDVRLGRLVAPSAKFSLGAGDVGRPLGTGVTGAQALARDMDANTYRFLGWDYMDGPANPCSAHKVAVEFVDSRNKRLSQVEFKFDAGRLVGAAGWSRSFETGRVKGASARR